MKRSQLEIDEFDFESSARIRFNRSQGSGVLQFGSERGMERWVANQLNSLRSPRMRGCFYHPLGKALL